MLELPQEHVVKQGHPLVWWEKKLEKDVAFGVERMTKHYTVQNMRSSTHTPWQLE